MNPLRSSVRFIANLLCTLALVAFFGTGMTAMAKPKLGYTVDILGDPTKPRQNDPSYGLLMSGGGEWPYDAFRWFAEKSGHGHLVILRATENKETSHEFYSKIGGFASVTTFVITDRKASTDPYLLKTLHNADAIFMAGGDQSNYIKMWRDTPIEDAINAHVRANKPLGGTSAGLAIMGEWAYGSMDGGSITSPEALKDPLGKANTIEGHFLEIEMLNGIVTDTHFKERDRQGRLAAFLAKAQHLGGKALIGFGVDEETVACVEANGDVKIYSNIAGAAWIYKDVNPEGLSPKSPLVAHNIKVVGIGTQSKFNFKTMVYERPEFIRTYHIENATLTKDLRWSLAIHGGAGVLDPQDMTPDRAVLYHQGLNDALKAGQTVLESGGSALEAVEASVRSMEDNPLFNAGRGAVFNAEGKNELDASIMDGKTLKAGAVAGVLRTKNPITLARVVMQKSGRLMLARDGADRFSLENGLEQVDPSYFYTEQRWKQYEAWKAKNMALIGRSHKYGTVGAVALDSDGHLAAATSTGGLTGKVYGRVGDTPIIGAGTMADDRYCATSATGTGEYFIRESAGRQICDRIRWNGQDIHSAAYDTIMAIGELGGDGGLIAMDKNGDVAFAINDIGMYRGWVASWRKAETAIYPNENLKPEGPDAKMVKTSQEMH